ncbi:MAG TPA: dihydrofolate reductase [Candidatus Paceibacterota bacterium]|nr:dihydrofolate reductase [Candidatus Paceibacterota bacterium]HRZ34187.1 dihydrofolate reductase [Candidatus Paceibacterota bacterium]
MTKTKNSARISLIAAIARGTRTVGKEGGGIPWHIKEDFRDFKEKTMGHPLIFGRKTWEEFGGRPLPGRTHIIVTKDTGYEVPEGHFVCDSVESAIEKAQEIEEAQNSNGGEIFVAGGAQIYAAAIKHADRVYLTVVDVDMDGPTKFPDYTAEGFTKVVSSRKSSDENYSYEFLVLEK